jgi:hypothetical protein
MSKRKPGRPKGSKGHRRLPLKRSEIQRTVRGVQDLGLTVHRVETYPEMGKIVVITAPSEDDASLADVESWNKAVKKDVKD